MKAKEFTFEDAVHVTHGQSAAANLKHCGCREMIVIDDPIFPGPADADPIRHRAKRKADLLSYLENFHAPDADIHREYWSQIAEDLLGAGELVSRLAEFEDRPIVLWTSSNFSDRLTFWWILDSLNKSRLNLDQWWIVEPHLHPLELESGCPRRTLGAFYPDELGHAFTQRQKLNRRLMRVGAALWQKYAGTSPAEFNRACLRNTAAFPNLTNETRIYLSYFPQVGMPGRSELRLSEFDQTLLDELHAERWLLPIDLMRGNLELNNFLVFGSLLIPKRLREWAAHSSDHPVILTRRERNGGDYTAFSCQLTPHGKRLRDYGLEAPAEAPAMHLGGCCAYAQDPTWVRRWRGRRSSIEVLR